MRQGHAIIAARLREYDGRQNLMRSYTSASGKKFTAGYRSNPSPWRVDITKRDVEELANVPQFEVRQFKSMDELEAMVDAEMQDRARAGQPAVRAAIESVRAGGAVQATHQRVFGEVVKGVKDLEEDEGEDAGEPPAAEPPPGPDPDDHPDDGDDDLSGAQEQTKRELLERAEALGLEVHRRMRKDEIAGILARAEAVAPSPSGIARKNAGRRS